MLQDMATSTNLFSKDFFNLNWQIYPFFHKTNAQKLASKRFHILFFIILLYFPHSV